MLKKNIHVTCTVLDVLILFQYFITEQGCYMYSMCIVPLYDTLGVEACNHIINQGRYEFMGF